MKYKTFLLVFSILSFVGCENDAELIVNEENLEISDFTFLPANPSMKDEVNILFYGCSYFQTTFIVVKNKKVNVKKHFNSRLNQHCDMVNDTIPLGRLKKGSYDVILEIIDINPFTADSVFHMQTKILTVTNK